MTGIARNRAHVILVDAIHRELAGLDDVQIWCVRRRWVSPDSRCDCMGFGAPDLVGIVSLDMWRPVYGARLDAMTIGRLFGLEVKTGRGRPSPEQIAWMGVVRRRGGFVAVVRSVEDARAALERCRTGGVE